MNNEVVKKNVNSREHSRSQSRAKLREKEILKYWSTTIALFEIARIVKCRQPTVRKIFVLKYGEIAVKNRSKNLYRLSKIGKNNPMTGKCGKKHHCFKGRAADQKGYFTVVKPLWWKGKNKSKRIFEHHLKYAEAHNLTSIPKKHCVHHIDGDTANNSPKNLQLMKISKHTKLHKSLKKCND